MSGLDHYSGLHHVSLLVADLQRACDFYVNILGLEIDESRPTMAFPGAWLKIGPQQIHLQCLDETASGTGAEHPGRDAHFALAVVDISKIELILEQQEISFNRSKSDRRALFCRDPDGNGIEFIEISK